MPRVSLRQGSRLRELGRRIVFHEQPEMLRPQLRRMLETWLRNRLQGREDAEAGRTVSDALAELGDLAVDEINAELIENIKAWLELQRP